MVSTGDLTINGGSGAVTGISNAAGSGNVLLSVTGTLALNAALNAGSGNITLLSSGSQTYAAAGNVSTTGGTIDVQATAATSTIAMHADTVFMTNGGNIRMMAGTVDGAGATVNAGGTITLGILDARVTADRASGLLTNQTVATSWGSVSVAATGGSILDNSSNTAVNVFAKELRLSAAGTSKAVGASGDALETEVATVSANVGSGGLFLNEATAIVVDQTAALTVQRVGTDGSTLTATTDTALSDFISAGHLVLVTQEGTITVNEGDAPTRYTFTEVALTVTPLVSVTNTPPLAALAVRLGPLISAVLQW